MTKNVLHPHSQSVFPNMNEYLIPFFSGTTRIIFSLIGGRISQKIRALASEISFGPHVGAIHPALYHPNNSTLREHDPHSVESLFFEEQEIKISIKRADSTNVFERNDQTRQDAFLTDRQSIQPTKISLPGEPRELRV